ncbi:enoyl-CoA hydratase [Nocardioides aromaticivorans]|uniref:Enoyl-CoA hydratase n=1 Tax=Nocardioides aromaticivorans TaxID=200618 RepID=A0ABX7PG27_9ACTN|nr:enoyl-CoA hydratase-related protein [Nocardioides aromaticivorans]QSR24851.1 enoyl-CoA hydratase [Nocardioides aromaticivorans]
MSDAIKVDDRGAVRRVVLNRPEQLNAMDVELLDHLVAALDACAHDDAVRVVVLTGAGRAFCAGGDLNAMAAGRDAMTPGHELATLRRHARAAELLRSMPAVTIAAVNGACAGAGLGLAAAADLRIAAESAVFRSAFLTAGLSGDFGTAWSLSRLLGEAAARELMLLNEKVSAQRARELGLVTKVVAADDLDAETDRLAAALAASAPLALRRMKTNLAEAATLGFAEAVARDSERHIACAFSDDAAEAGAAFLARRTPQFTGH